LFVVLVCSLFWLFGCCFVVLAAFWLCLSLYFFSSLPPSNHSLWLEGVGLIKFCCSFKKKKLAIYYVFFWFQN
jgi:hypothetical protein